MALKSPVMPGDMNSTRGLKQRGCKHRPLLANFSYPVFPCEQGGEGSVGNQRDGRQSLDRHDRDGQCQGCNAPGAGWRGARPRVVGPRPAGHMEAWGEHEASP